MTWLIPVISIIVGVIALDQISKLLVLKFLYEGEVALIPEVLHFTYVENRGMAFGMLSDRRWIFMVLSVVGIALVAFYMVKYVKNTLGRVALSLIIGGGIGNMIDRVAYGFVVDFIDFCAWPQLWGWVFNVADAAVCIGAGLFIVELVIELIDEIKKEKQRREEKNAPTASSKEPTEQAPREEENDG